MDAMNGLPNFLSGVTHSSEPLYARFGGWIIQLWEKDYVSLFRTFRNNIQARNIERNYLKIPIGHRLIEGYQTINNGSHSDVLEVSTNTGGAEKRYAYKLRAEGDELDIMRMLDHPNILNIRNLLPKSLEHIGAAYFQLTEKDGFEFLEEYAAINNHGMMMPLMDGARNLFAARIRLTESEKTKIFWQMVSAVKYLHEHEVVHMDLKLENILIDKDKNVFLADFGLGPGSVHLFVWSVGRVWYSTADPTGSNPLITATRLPKFIHR